MALLSVTINLDDKTLVQRSANYLRLQISEARWEMQEGIDDGLDTNGTFAKFMPTFDQYVARIDGAKTFAELQALAHELNSELKKIVLAEQLLDQSKGD